MHSEWCLPSNVLFYGKFPQVSFLAGLGLAAMHVLLTYSTLALTMCPTRLQIIGHRSLQQPCEVWGCY